MIIQNQTYFNKIQQKIQKIIIIEFPKIFVKLKMIKGKKGAI